jgi:hypothetical protein
MNYLVCGVVEARGLQDQLAVDTRREIRDMRVLLPVAMLKSIEMQKLVVKAGVRIVYTALRMQKCGNFPLPEV